MQTFLTSPSFEESAAFLDSKRLGNQCYRETLTLFRGGWKNHPASKMWKGYENSLARYGLALAKEMEERGGWKQEVTDRWIKFWSEAVKSTKNTGDPPWLGNKEFHRSHQSNLIRKDKNYYEKLFPSVPDNLPYIWPQV